MVSGYPSCSFDVCTVVVEEFAEEDTEVEVSFESEVELIPSRSAATMGGSLLGSRDLCP